MDTDMATLGEDLVALADHMAAEARRLQAAAAAQELHDAARKRRKLEALQVLIASLQAAESEGSKPQRLRKLADAVARYENLCEQLGLPSGQMAAQMADTLRAAA